MAIYYLFWISAAIILYSYVGYTIILLFIHVLKILIGKKKIVHINKNELPSVAIVIIAYNEEDIIEQKIKNTLAIDYPQNRLNIICITDGSSDRTNEIIKKHDRIKLYHQPERKGKTAAMNRVMDFVRDDITIFTDANTMISSQAIKEIIYIFNQDHVGCIAGEKQIKLHDKDKAVAAGEGFYWKYESLIKYLESSVNSVVGAAGELFAIRTGLFEKLEENTILDDFELSLRIALKGYKIKYSAKAYAQEDSSFSIKEEMKRKIRIAAGCFQTLFRLTHLFNPLKAKFLSFQFISHKLLRWIFVPICFISVFISNFMIILESQQMFYLALFYVQCMFYILVIVGAVFQNYYSRFRFLYLPYYMFFMNFSMIKGMFRYFSGKQRAQWEKVRRA